MVYWYTVREPAFYLLHVSLLCSVRGVHLSPPLLQTRRIRALQRIRSSVSSRTQRSPLEGNMAAPEGLRLHSGSTTCAFPRPCARKKKVSGYESDADLNQTSVARQHHTTMPTIIIGRYNDASSGP